MTAAPQVPVQASSAVTVLDVYTRQVEMSGKLDLINDRLKPIADHESRLRRLEDARARVYGASVALGALFGGGAGAAVLAALRR